MELIQINDPVNPQDFVTQFEQKFTVWGNIVTQPLRDTWYQNALVFNNAIANTAQKIKYIVSAPTGSAKTENTITYCAMLPSHIKVLISTNLTKEADRLAKHINCEAGENRACAFHSKNDVSLDEAAEYQIVTISHEFYKRHQKSDDIWQKIANKRDLIIIDEALDTLDEISVSKSDVEVTFNFFASLQAKKQFQGSKHFERCLMNLTNDINFLTNANYGKSTLISKDKMIYIINSSGNKVPIKSLHMHRYFSFLLLLENNKFAFNQILTGINDTSKDEQIKENIINTLEALNSLQDRQAYVTANKGEYSLHRVTESLPKQSLVCFDATADINAIYDLRMQFHNDLSRIDKISNVRNYSSVTLHTATTVTGSQSISNALIGTLIQNIQFGRRTLFITRKSNVPMVQAELESNYSSYDTDVVNWGAVTGLNTWQDFDTCVVIGLNHKPVSFVQNRVLVNTNENEAFGANQTIHYDKVLITNLVSEIIQAINRIRVRKVIDAQGNCDTTNIYLTLPSYDEQLYTYIISGHMPGIHIKSWNLPTTSIVDQTMHRNSVVSHLLKTMKVGDKIGINDPRDALGIGKDSYRDVVGKSDSEKIKFKSKLSMYGFEITDDWVAGSKKPIKKKFIMRLK